MGLVQIEQSELDVLRKERDDARTEAAKVADEQTKRQSAEQAAEAAETAKVAAETERDELKKKLDTAEEESARSELKTKRMGALGNEFVAKLGEFTKGRLDEQAGVMSEEDWDNRLKELEEVTAVKRDAKKDGDPDPADPANKDGDADNKDGETFAAEEVASLAQLGGGSAASTNGNGPSDIERRSVVGSLADAFKPTS